ncbi:hypothetical protein FDUTEX481_04000 [Tolypothrix sp. PCC 7601]|nr:hypothetical protein FDUTEX481_04000 [Tolypothrix sp. PCC 7601]
MQIKKSCQLPKSLDIQFFDFWSTDAINRVSVTFDFRTTVLIVPC